MSVLREGLRHHVWATRQLLDLCAAVPHADLERAVPGLFGSALETLRHIVDADASYLFVLSGGDLGRGDFDADELTLPEVSDLHDENGRGYEDLLTRAIDEDVDLTRVRPDGSVRHATVAIRLAQVLHHGSDHRSQVCTALTEAGHAPPDFDVWSFGDHTGLVRENPAPSG